jgi:eukaryotic-like serine/threonine-protein kinase
MPPMAGVGRAASRYDSIVRLAAGGMATVWVGTVRGALGFRQLVAIKKPHPHLLEDPQFRAELLAEARLASMIHHANVVDVRDVEIDDGAMTLVMDYIEGASLGELIVAAAKREVKLPPGVAVRIVLDACAGLHAAHELVDERDRPVNLVHRDVSPQNILVGVDGISRVTDFGVAKFARKNMQSTSNGSLKGKLAYMAPEYLRGQAIDRRFDVFATGVVLWEALAGKRLFRGENEADTLGRVLHSAAPLIGTVVPSLGSALDDVLAHALEKDRDQRFQNAAAMGAALEATARDARLVASHTEVATALKDLVGPAIEQRRALIRSKLASEPSVASLMGGVDPARVTGPSLPPTVGPNPAPTQSAPAPTTAPGGSELGAAPGVEAHALGPAASTLRDAPPAAVPATTVSMTGTARPATTEPGPHAMNETALPTTQPMTDRVQGVAVAHTPRTLASAAPAEQHGHGTQLSAGMEGSSPVVARTQLSEGPPAWPSTPPPMESGPEAAFHDPSRAYSAVELSNRHVAPPPRRWGVPVAVGLLVVTVGVGGLWFHQRSQSAPPSAAHEDPLVPLGATASSEPAASPSASTSASVAPSAGSATAAETTAHKPPPKRAGSPPRVSPPATVAPTAAPPVAPTAKPVDPRRPPPDPYKSPGAP